MNENTKILLVHYHGIIPDIPIKYRIAGMFRRVKQGFVFEGENDFRGFYFRSFVSLHMIKHRPRLIVSLSRSATSDHA